MANNESMEMYLETVFILEQEHGHAHGADIAKMLGVSKPSVTKAMRVLKEKGLVIKEAYGSINLTRKGLEQSREIYRNHQLITAFLEKSLGLSSLEADQNACRIEHVIGEEVLSAIEKYLEQAD